jgi:fructokinase
MTATHTRGDDAPVVVIGDALVDELIGEHPGNGSATGSVEAPGGSALNVAVGLAVLGVPAVLVAMIGDDADGHMLRAHLASHDVPLFASRSPLGTGRALSDRTGGEPSYSFSLAMLDRKLTFSASVLAAISAAPAVAITGFPFDDQQQVDEVQRATASARLLVDPNPRSGMLHDRTLFRHNLEAIAARGALVKIGEEDAALLYDESIEAVAARFVGLGATVLATAGARGATIYHGANSTSRPISSQAGAIVDTMGAGDATFSAVIAALVTAGRSGVEAQWGDILEAAMSVAAATIRHRGGLLRLPD